MSTLAADRARLADLDAQILDLERSLSALRSQRQPVFERLSACTYPVLTLPNEITTEIFIHFLPNYPSCPPLTALVSHRSRWEHLIVYDFSPSHLLAMDGPMPLLQTLKLYTDDPHIEVSFLEAPLLRTVVLWDTASETLTLPGRN
ncbi:hypothetical protein B0H14DRAFT_3509476 [Mycena olivaceomarginata]|nr:hypothetical protein B0H14DRAFT_3509476 [Mycena olivaceomarginata]